MRGDELFYQVEYLQNALIATATQDNYDTEDYINTRTLLLNNSKIKKYLPDFVLNCRTLDQFWPYIKYKFSTYQERRQFIWDSFHKLLTMLEQESSSNFDNIVSITISENEETYIKEEWDKALERRATDPEGAITIARTLVETTCKYILDKMDIKYDDNIDLPKLYALTASQMNLAPKNHNEEIYKQILGGCQSVIHGLASLRNQAGDSHGKRTGYVKPHERHAKLAVNLAGSLSSFLFDTFANKQKDSIKK